MSSFLIAAGTYERLLYGIEATWTSTGNEPTNPQLALNLVFSFPAHIGCIKSVASGGRFLASGGTDEQIKVYNLNSRKEFGTLMHHQSTVSALQFYGKSHMISGAEGGQLSIWRTKDWESLVTLKGHNGRKAAVVKLGKEGLQVLWCPHGEQYAVLTQSEILVCNVADATVGQTMKLRGRINGMLATVSTNGRELLVCGGNDKHLYIYDVKSAECVLSAKLHDNRIKTVQLVTMPRPHHPEETPLPILVTASTDGQIKAWDFAAMLAQIAEPSEADTGTKEPAAAHEFIPLGTYDTGCRITCLTVATGSQPQ
ncbi:60s ribosome biogenesis protein mak11 [Dimargaris xerosporica]|nr:60s ribosome biogenesis protein mak11 [Dimargaris xerosporica]